MRRFDHNEVTTKHSELRTRHNEVTARHNEETTTHKEETTPHNDETTPHKKVMAFHTWRLEIPLNLLWCTKVLYFLFIQLLKTFSKAHYCRVIEETTACVHKNAMFIPLLYSCSAHA